MKLDFLEIQKNIEETRLILGQKLEKFLLQKTGNFFAFFERVIAAKSFTFFSVAFVVSLSLFLRSNRDFGHDSALYLEIADKMLLGGRYYENFYEPNLPFAFIIAVVAQILAKFFSLNTIISYEILLNFLGIFSLYFSYKILVKARLVVDRRILNLLIFSFACGFFLRFFTLPFNEFGTKSSLLLLLLFPYISYQIRDEKSLQKIDQILIGILAAALFCLKPQYGIFVICFEIFNLIKKRNFLAIFCLRNFVALFFLLGYFLLLFCCFNEYVLHLIEVYGSYYHKAKSVVRYLIIDNLFCPFFLIFLLFDLVKKEEILQKLLVSFFAATLMIILEIIYALDQIFVLYSLALPLVFLLIFFAQKNQFFVWKKVWFFALPIFFIFQFDGESLFKLSLDITAFWPVFILFLRQDFLQKNSLKWAAFILLLALNIWAFFIPGLSDFALILSLIIFAALVIFYQKKSGKKELNNLSACCVFIILARFLFLQISAILDGDSFYKSPNFANEAMMQLSKNYVKNDENVAIISYAIPGSYPFRTYAGKKNDNAFAEFSWLFSSDKSQDFKIKEYALRSLNLQLSSDKTKLVFVEKTYAFEDANCHVGVLENNFSNEEFRQNFLQNYKFLTRILQVRVAEKQIKFFGEDEKYESGGKSEIIERDVEVYVRK
jgi:hypothetical protein